MTKAKAKKRPTKSLRMWALLSESGHVMKVFVFRENAISFRLDKMTVCPAILTWTEPRRAKR